LQLKPERVSSSGWSAIRNRLSTLNSQATHAPAATHTPATTPLRVAAGWRWLAAASILGFAILFGNILSRSQPAWQPVATLAQNNTAIMWRLERTPDSQRIRLRAVNDEIAPNGGSYELWVLPAAGGAPVSLGLLPARGDLSRVLNAQQQVLLRTAMNVAVSLEPGGGSRNGAPTQVLFAAAVSAAI
jgi:anti-sigma-K factor RskA